jgi:hypothetical protein
MLIGIRPHTRTLGAGGRDLLKWILEILTLCVYGVKWIQPAQDRIQWRVYICKVINLPNP